MPSSRFRPCVAVAALLLIATSSLAAQRGGAVELTPLVRYAFYPDSFGLANTLSVGAEAGLFVNRNLSLELEGVYGGSALPDSTAVSISTLAARLVVHLPLQGETHAVVGGGYSRTWFGQGLSGAEDGLDALVGFRFGLAPRVGLRLEATGDYLMPPASAAGRAWVVGVQAGLSILAGPLGARDSDRDGVPNGEDRCPGTAPGEPVDPTGCPLPRDSDGDGVLDGTDRCPSTQPGQRVDLTGCNPDLDGDGVANAVDRCPDSPAGEPVDAFGCPQPKAPADSDGDGVPDARDRCPGTPAGARVDALGCTVAAPQPPAPPRLILRGVTFATGSAVLSDSSRVWLAATAATILADPGVRLEVAGYTDDTGARAVNERLSLARAESVRAFLVEAGVPAASLVAKGYGPADPIASNATAAGRAENRRVELRRVATD